MVPDQLRLIPVFVMLTNWHLIGNFSGYILINLVTATNLFFMRQYFLTIPKDFEEAAKLDGAGYFKTFWRVMLPLALPAISTLVILQFQGTWNDFFWPLILFGQGSPSHYTVQLGLAELRFTYSTCGRRSAPAASSRSSPSSSIFLAFQRYFVARRRLVGGEGMSARAALGARRPRPLPELVAARARERCARARARRRRRVDASPCTRRSCFAVLAGPIAAALVHCSVTLVRTGNVALARRAARGCACTGAAASQLGAAGVGARRARCGRRPLLYAVELLAGRSPSSRSTSSCCSASTRSCWRRSRSPGPNGRCGSPRERRPPLGARRPGATLLLGLALLLVNLVGIAAARHAVPHAHGRLLVRRGRALRAAAEAEEA